MKEVALNLHLKIKIMCVCSTNFGNSFKTNFQEPVMGQMSCLPDLERNCSVHF